MANPFLMTDDELPADEPVCNPFLMQTADDDVPGADDADDPADNPFFADAKNPFADFGGGAGGEDDPAAVDQQTANIFGVADAMAEPPKTNATDGAQDPAAAGDDDDDDAGAPNIDSAMSFFGTTISDEDEHDHEMQGLPDPIQLNVHHHDDEATDDELNMPPVRPVPPSRTTQDLILSVSDQLDQTSSHLLDRIPVTRTPSPVSMRDLHTPSPTGDLLDVSDGDHAFGDVQQQQQPPPSADDASNLFGDVCADNPFATEMDATASSAVKPEPPRPPPPRPTPPRPSPPRRPSPPQMPAANGSAQPPPPPRPAPPPAQQAQTVEPGDLFDMFGSDMPAPSAQPKKPPPPKSNEDIMSLFSNSTAAPANDANDLLSGDILSMDNASDHSGFPAPSPSTHTVPTPVAGGFASIASAICEPVGRAQPPPAPKRPAVPAPPAAAVVPNDKRHSTDVSDTDNVSGVSPVISDVVTLPDTTPPAVEKENSILDDADTLSPSGVSTVESVASDYQQKQQHYLEQTPQQQPLSDHSESESLVAQQHLALGSVATPSPSVNPFASPEEEQPTEAVVTLSAVPVTVQQVELSFSVEPPAADEFDAFAAKFDSVKKEDNNLLDGFGPPSRSVSSEFAWGNEETAAAAFGDDPTAADGNIAVAAAGSANGFGADDDDGGFDSFLAMAAPPPSTLVRSESRDSDDDTGGKGFNVVIRPRDEDLAAGLAGAVLAPPPRGSQANSMYSGDSSPRVNPFDKGDEDAAAAAVAPPVGFPAELVDQTAGAGMGGVPHQPVRTDSQETPPTPLFDEDVSQPLEDFPRVTYVGDGWEMQLRQPNKKKITGQRFWKKIWLRVVNPNENPVIQLRNAPTDKEPFQELPLQACYSVSDISAQQFDQFGKIFTVKLQYIFYKERPGVRPGQVTKAGRLSDKLSQFAAYAIQGDYQGVKEFGSDLKKLGLPVEHAPQVSQLFKIGSHNYEDVKQFLVYIDELLFKYNVHRDRALTYKMEEVQVTAVDELYVEQNAEGQVMKQICRVRLFFLGFLSGMPTIELGVNDLWRQGKEVVGRHDIIPVVTEEWIRLEGVEFHSCVQQNEYERSRTIRFQPPDACYIELMRFRVRPPKNRELPFQLKAVWCVTGNKVELRADVLVPGFASRKLGQIPCEDVSIRFPIPECWIYLFRVEKHFRYGSVKSAHRRTGKIKGIERILGTVDQLQESLIEVTSGQAKYEHHHRAIVWRCPRLPKEGQGAYTTHQLVVRMALTSYDQIPEQLAPFCYVEFTMPATQVSHMTVRSVSVQESDSDDPPEKYVRYLARHEYRVGIEHTTGESLNPYLAATSTRKAPEPVKEEAPAAAMPAIAGSDSDSDSN